MAASNFRNQLKERTAPPTVEHNTAQPLPVKQPTNSQHERNMQAQQDAMVVYDKFFSLQASHQLGFSDSFRFHIESNICHEQGPRYTCFDEALRVVLYVLQVLFFPGYLRSSLYDSYIRDLMRSVKNSR